MNKCTVSIICCYNNEDVMQNMLYKSVLDQNMNCEFIPVDNRYNKFASAASALNYGASVSNGEYLVFTHQDIEFNDSTCIQSVVNYLDELGKAIVGFAGRKAEDSKVYSNMKHGINEIYAGDKRISAPTIVQTLDECFIALKRDLFLNYGFDEKACDNWHLYTVDLCLDMGRHNIKSYAIPSYAFHKSSGVLNEGYFKSLNKIVAKYRKDYRKIYSTCSIVKTNAACYLLYRMSRKIKFMIKKYIK